MKRVPVRNVNGRIFRWVFVDDEDYDRVMEWRWFLCSDGRYFARKDSSERTRTLYMHREILGISHLSGRVIQVDHVNGKPWDNQRCNLRIASVSDNLLNRRMPRKGRLGLRGVHWHAGQKKYRARIRREGKEIILGLFDDPHEAHRVVCDYLREIGVPRYQEATA